jgi:chromosome segregation ATPase
MVIEQNVKYEVVKATEEGGMDKIRKTGTFDITFSMTDLENEIQATQRELEERERMIKLHEAEIENIKHYHTDVFEAISKFEKEKETAVFIYANAIKEIHNKNKDIKQIKDIIAQLENEINNIKAQISNK